MPTQGAMLPQCLYGTAGMKELLEMVMAGSNAVMSLMPLWTQAPTLHDAVNQIAGMELVQSTTKAEKMCLV